MTYRLSIHQIDHSCLFDLTWGQGQRLTASLPYPAQLTTLYQTWQRAYLGYYKQALRGRAGAVGQVLATPVDLHSQLVQAEARLLSEFHQWLKHESLYDLRAELMKGQPARSATLELFITCTPLEVARLPWETWEVSVAGQADPVQIVRAPATIRSESLNRQPFRRGKARVLAILGDETGLDFQGDRTALNRFDHLLAVTYLGWQPGEDGVILKQKVRDAIADPLGWDVLFFAGHSNESALLDGQLSIAPHTTLSIRELAPCLRKAQQRGLQFALFNSCSGLDIANGLIDLGLSQVAIMREPIHNDVAHRFLVQFLQRLARFEDGQQALLGTCQWLKLEQNLTYPSAHLVPSLFRHPQSVPYQVQPTGWKAWLRQWRPRLWEGVAVGAIATLSLIPPVQNWLLDQRVMVQALYRDMTGQVQAVATPPLVLVQIDDRTLQERRIAQPTPMDRQLLADITQSLTTLKARVVGIDYLLDRPQPEDVAFKRALSTAVANQSTWFIFGTDRNTQGQWLGVHPEVASLSWSLEGDIWVPWWRVLPRRPASRRPLPFSYQVAIARYLVQQPGNPPAPLLTSQSPVQKLIDAYLNQGDRRIEAVPPQVDFSPITALSYHFGQRWLQPLLDFSIPPEQVYTSVSAWDLLQSPQAVMQSLGLTTLEDAVVLVVAGGYDEAGLTGQGEDNFPLPSAIAYWQGQAGIASFNLTGGEAHAYMIHHLLNRRLVVPIPDLWLVLVAALVGKGLSLYLQDLQPKRPGRRGAGLIGLGLGYGLVSLQLYITSAVLLPWLLPALTVWICTVSSLRRTARET